MFDKSINTIEEAKDFFLSMGCSSFHMSREYPERYDEYKKMKITEAWENEWRQESFEIHVKKLFEVNEVSDFSTLWAIHSSMTELFRQLKTTDTLKKMLVATQYIREKVPLKDMVIVAETINGRISPTYRDGLIYLSYELQCPSLAKEFAELSLHFATFGDKKVDFERCKSATQICNQLITKLGLGCY
jgi:hypothetical protein